MHIRWLDKLAETSLYLFRLKKNNISFTNINRMSAELFMTLGHILSHIPVCVSNFDNRNTWHKFKLHTCILANAWIHENLRIRLFGSEIESIWWKLFSELCKQTSFSVIENYNKPVVHYSIFSYLSRALFDREKTIRGDKLHDLSQSSQCSNINGNLE